MAGVTTTAAALVVITLGGTWWRAVETSLGHEAVAQLELTTRPAITLVADPLLDFPRGHLPRIAMVLNAATWQHIPLPPITVALTDVRVAPQALLGLAPPRLCAPAGLRLSFKADGQRITQTLNSLAQLPALQKTPLPRGPLRRVFGSPVSFDNPRVTLSEGQIHIQVNVIGPSGRRTPVFVKSGLRSPEGQTLRLDKIAVQIKGQAVPSSLLKLFTPRIPPVLDLRPLTPPGGRLRIDNVTLAPGLFTLALSGQLPAHEAPWLRPPGWPVLREAANGE